MKFLSPFALVVLLTVVLLCFGVPLGEAYARLWNGSLGTPAGLSQTLIKMTPMLLCALGVALAWKSGAFNIGTEGQFVVGGIFGAFAAKIGAGLPGPVLLMLILAATSVGGGVFAFLAGWLQWKRGIQVVISTILMNFLALQLLDYLVSGPLRDPVGMLPQSCAVPESARLPRVLPGQELHAGLFIALVMALVCWLLLAKSRVGFHIRLVGSNPDAARVAKVSVERTQLLALTLSGALCGLAAGIEFTAISGRLDSSFDQQWGFLGIPVAILGGLHPLGVVASSAGFGALFAGSLNFSRVVPGGDRLIFILQGLAVLSYLAIRRYEEQKRIRSAQSEVSA